MSATGNLSTPQFGSVADGTYDLAAHEAWHTDHFRPVRRQQYAQIKAMHTTDIQAARTANAQGDKAGAARALTSAARSRRMAEVWSHLKR